MIWAGIVAAGLAAIWLAARLAFPLPSTEGRATATAIPSLPDTALGPAAMEAIAAHPDLTGVVPLADGQAALKSRLELIGLAQRSIDAQYYIWHQDDSGLLLLDALHRAALRGVRVRLLLDDNGIESTMDPLLAALDAIPGFEVRIFNPSTVRRPKWAGYLLNPVRINRRMHNKSLIVDGAAAIVGGRNIGDEYFSVGDTGAYLDLDVLCVGQVVAETAAVFDDYWNARASIELTRLRGTVAADIDTLEARLAESRATGRARAMEAAGPTPSFALSRGEWPVNWARVEALADPPGKALGDAEDNALLFHRLSAVLMETERTLDIVVSYFVPGEKGADALEALSQSGRQLRILTNSLLATDVPLVHAGYAKKREELLRAGISLFEVLPIEGVPQGREELGPFGLSGSSLHAKTFAVDRKRLFVGSFNFDPRSVALNCEMGFLIHSPALAELTARTFSAGLARYSLRPALTGEGMVWREPRADGSVVIHHDEPGSSWRSRALVTMLGWLPIEWLI